MPVTFSLDEELGRRIARVLRAFPEDFGHIKAKDVMPIRVSDVPHPTKAAEVRKIPPAIVAGMVRPYKLQMLVYEDLYYEMPKRVQTLVVVHELEHIKPHPIYLGEYRMKDHEIQDWVGLVTTLGPGWWASVGELQFDVLKLGKSNWRDAVGVLSKRLNGRHTKKKSSAKAYKNKTRD